MGPIGIPELLIILLILVLIFGATRLPEIGKGLGQAITNFRSSMKGDKEQKNLGSSAREEKTTDKR
ncbi:MAG TPA: twin-arginine translocase TatA/TatE family subunit [Acidobacteriota bacterium]|nr:twin-arginine translocase TatA/TatE family subunit [Acidobacteriota bacterium]